MPCARGSCIPYSGEGIHRGMCHILGDRSRCPNSSKKLKHVQNFADVKWMYTRACLSVSWHFWLIGILLEAIKEYMSKGC
jgi:hypothetical protein